VKISQKVLDNLGYLRKLVKAAGIHTAGGWRSLRIIKNGRMHTIFSGGEKMKGELLICREITAQLVRFEY